MWRNADLLYTATMLPEAEARITRLHNPRAPTKGEVRTQEMIAQVRICPVGLDLAQLIHDLLCLLPTAPSPHRKRNDKARSTQAEVTR